ncbi:MAG: hypothetical protein ACUVYA_02435 [Planctomycetota bacterium]
MRRARSMASLALSVACAAFALSASREVLAAVKLQISQREASAPEGEPAIAIGAEGNRVVVRVASGSYNCCSIADATLAIRGASLEIHERNAGTYCESLLPCFFDVTYALSRLAPGTYEVSLFGEDGGLRAREKVEVAAIAAQSECIEGPVEREKAVASTTPDSLVVEHRSAYVQCCLEFAPVVEVDGSRIRIVAKDVSPAPCKCLCHFDLRVEIPGLAPGTYAIEYVAFDGKTLLETELTVPGPRVAVTQASVRRTAEVPEERAAIFVDGDDIVVEHVGLVEQSCLDLDAWAELDLDADPPALAIRASDDGPPCDCVGPYIVRIRARDLPPGRYRVECGLGGGVAGDVNVGADEVFFLRGYVSADDFQVAISDPIQILGHLFLGSPEELPCEDAADANDDGELNLTDAVYLLGYLFLGGPEPRPPFPWPPGLDPTADELGCEAVPCDPRKLAYDTRPGGPWDFVEFCIPSGRGYEEEIRAAFPKASFLPGVPGRIGCSRDEVLVTIDWADVNRSKLCWLSGKAYVREIRGSHWE